MNTLLAVAMLFGAFTTGIGFWAFGQWLHGRSYGDRSGGIDATLSKGQRNVGRFLGPLDDGLVGVTCSISCVPLLRNRHSREMREDLEELERQHRKDRN